MNIVDFFEKPELWDSEDTFKPLVNSIPETPEMNTPREARTFLSQYHGLDPKVLLSEEEHGFALAQVRNGIEIINSDFNIEPNIYLIGMTEKNRFVIENLGGVCGYAFKDSVLVYFHPKSEWRKNLLKTVVHELSHVYRMQFSNPYDTFLNWLIFEGLAEVYNANKFPNDELPAFVTSVPEVEIDSYLDEVKKFWLDPLANDDESINEWFFGNPEKKIPAWLGYNIGYYLVKKHRSAFPTIKWSEYFKICSKDFV